MRVENLIAIESGGASLNKEFGISRSDPVTVTASDSAKMSLSFELEKAQIATTRSQENCLINNHRLTCERQEGDFFSMRNA